jgi:hypothetical protein
LQEPSLPAWGAGRERGREIDGWVDARTGKVGLILCGGSMATEAGSKRSIGDRVRTLRRELPQIKYLSSKRGGSTGQSPITQAPHIKIRKNSRESEPQVPRTREEGVGWLGRSVSGSKEAVWGRSRTAYESW